MALPVTKLTPLQIPLEDVRGATKNFHPDNIISTAGSFGPAYKGQLLRSGNLINIAARRLDRRYGLGDFEFLTEVTMLSHLSHPNLVSMIGYCDEEGEKIVLTTYVANGSLEQFLNRPNYLTWGQRLKIGFGVARALSYLHSDDGHDYGVIHRNINSYSILLDENWEPKLSGFEISIKQPVNRMDRVILCEAIGMEGYTDPAIEKTGGVTCKAYIYAFGVVLFELLCGRLAVIQNEENGSFLAPLARYHYENTTLKDIIHPDLFCQMSLQSLRKYSKVAYSCLMEEHAHRPDMSYILHELNKLLELQLQRQIIVKNLSHLKISIADLKLATDNFSNKYRIGLTKSYASYKTEFHYFDKENSSYVEGRKEDQIHKRHNSVYIKRIVQDQDKGKEIFFREIQMLTSVKHHRIVKLLGFCAEGSEMILVIENLPNGSLGDNMQNANNMHILTWEKRLKICIDVAHALIYLHHEMEDQQAIINGCINCSNIILDENWGAKINRFDQSVFMPSSLNYEAFFPSNVVGVKGYVDPEYKKTGKIKTETDVYSFGVILFEILCGRRSYDPFDLKKSKKGLVSMARECFINGTIEEMIDPLIKEESGENNFIQSRGPDKDSLKTFIDIAYQCVARTQDQRPIMKVVVKELERALCLQEKRWQHHEMEKLVQEQEKALELRLAQENLGENLENLKISLACIIKATKGFSGKYKFRFTGFSTLYRVELRHLDKKNLYPDEGRNKDQRHNHVVIKRITRGNRQGEEMFFREIQLLISVKHQGIVKLLGFCVEGSEMILVLENFSNGCLIHYLGNVNNLRILTWEKRLKICIDVAQALNHLSYVIEHQKLIINSSGIGLDENWEAKIFEFGNFKTESSDVYSFGLFLFEVLCGRTTGVVAMAKQCFNTGTLKDMIDPVIKDEIGDKSSILHRGPNKDSLNTFIKIAYECVADLQDQHLTMKVVVKELEKAMFLQRNNKDNLVISLEDIKRATQDFNPNNYIGGGGFGKVYVGKLQDDNGTSTIVAKRLYGHGKQQFLSEIQILLEYKHANIIGLLGYCDEEDEKIIVYEYASNGSLDRYLKDAHLTWLKRLNICIEVAIALNFLHGGLAKQAKVVHRDIKTANILLDHDWKAKLADIGLSLISAITKETDYVIDRACGTPGYVDPLYEKSKFLTIESDIYSFGVVLFEILCGRATFEFHKQAGQYLPEYVKNKIEEGNHEEMVYKQIREGMVPKSLTVFQEIAYKCLHHEREKRPTIREVLSQLQKAKEFQMVRACQKVVSDGPHKFNWSLGSSETNF